MARAGVTHADIDVLMTYDCFVIMPILFLEAAGFVGEGEGGAFFAEGRAEVGGDLPVNPHGGMMSYAHPGNPGGLFMFPGLSCASCGASADRGRSRARRSGWSRATVARWRSGR